MSVTSDRDLATTTGPIAQSGSWQVAASGSLFGGHVGGDQLPLSDDLRVRWSSRLHYFHPQRTKGYSSSAYLQSMSFSHPASRCIPWVPRSQGVPYPLVSQLRVPPRYMLRNMSISSNPSVYLHPHLNMASSLGKPPAWKRERVDTASYGRGGSRCGRS